MKRTLIILFLSIVSFSAGPISAGAADNTAAAVKPSQLSQWLSGKKAVAVDTMSRLECGDHRIPGSLCIPCDVLERDLPARVKDRSVPVVLYCDQPPCECSADQAQKLGYTNAADLAGGLVAWKRSGYDTETVRRIPRRIVPSISAEELSTLLEKKGAVLVVDIRPEKVYLAGHLQDALNIPLDSLESRYAEILIDSRIVVVDEEGRRSYLAASYLASKGIEKVQWLNGGMEKWRAFLARTKTGAINAE